MFLRCLQDTSARHQSNGCFEKGRISVCCRVRWRRPPKHSMICLCFLSQWICLPRSLPHLPFQTPQDRPGSASSWSRSISPRYLLILAAALNVQLKDKVTSGRELITGCRRNLSVLHGLAKQLGYLHDLFDLEQLNFLALLIWDHVFDRLIIDLLEADPQLQLPAQLGHRLGFAKDLLYGPRNHAPLFRVLIAKLARSIPLHSVRLARASLPVCENADVVAIDYTLHQIWELFVDVILVSVWIEDMLEVEIVFLLVVARLHELLGDFEAKWAFAIDLNDVGRILLQVWTNSTVDTDVAFGIL